MFADLHEEEAQYFMRITRGIVLLLVGAFCINLASPAGQDEVAI